ncbi:MAG: flagellar biosynthesis anti-sigma factor FlgM [bacterium]|nr:flagellar biosynthesis anti-sigma factor FlgM [bacterium]
MGMDKINSSPLQSRGLLDRLRGTARDETKPTGTPATSADLPAAATADKADISEAARRLVDLKHVVDAGRDAIAQLPDVRPEKVTAARERLASGFYNALEVRQVVAGRLGGVFDGIEKL